MDGQSWYENEKCLRSAYFIVILVRFFWTLLPQTGYLYPDEFFQSPEIMAKHFFSINTTTTWEWNERYPVRSPVSAFLSSGAPFSILKALWNIRLLKLNSYFLLVFPRIYMTVLSLLSVDIPVYILAKKLNLQPFSNLFVLSTSYVTQVLGTRPFSNVLETGILGILLVILIAPIKQQFSATERELMDKNTSNSPFLLAGGLTALGFFCRQTFLVFALTPYAGYFIIQLMKQENTTKPEKTLQVIIRLVLVAFGFFSVSLVIVLVDSWYFGYLQRKSIVFTPWNFITYNTMQAHKHGHHPVFTHFLVNIPLLFGPITLLWYSKLASLLSWKKLLLQGIDNGEPDHPTDNKLDLDYKNYQLVLVLSAFVPVLLLSFIPHQEPRFIMPVLIPFILLFSHKIVGPKHSPIFLLSWCVWNFIGCLFFGVLHQGGVVPSLIHLETIINNNVMASSVPYCHHLVFFHTYMPPTHLLAWPNEISTTGHRLYIHDLAGNSEEFLHQTISKLKEDYCDKNQSMVRFYLILRNFIN